MKLLVINGPNLNLLGVREPSVYGTDTYEDLCNFLKECVLNKDVELEIYQSNHEGAIIDKIHEAYYNKLLSARKAGEEKVLEKNKAIEEKFNIQ